MARILDFYAVRWEYEPRTFPILWNLEGDVVESFSPDFYLPDMDLFLELTTLKQRLVRKKNRKLRRLRELYPDIRIKLFYARDFRAMMLKYGRLALVGSLSGTLGQVVPERAVGADGSLATGIQGAGAASAAPAAGPCAVRARGGGTGSCCYVDHPDRERRGGSGACGDEREYENAEHQHQAHDQTPAEAMGQPPSRRISERLER